MEIDDIIIEDLFSFFTALESSDVNNRLKNNSSIIPYLSFVILSNERCYEYISNKIHEWSPSKVYREFEACPWIKCKFVTRIIDSEKQKRIFTILLYLNSEIADDAEIYKILSLGWKRIALYIGNHDYIDLTQAPLRKRTEDKWALCFMSYIKHKVIIQAKLRDQWYKVSSELFFYYKHIIQRIEIDTIRYKSFYRLQPSDDMYYVDVDDNIDRAKTHEDVLAIQTLILLREREKQIKNNICGITAVNNSSHQSQENPVCERRERNSFSLSLTTQAQSKKTEFYDEHISELKRIISNLTHENIRLKQTLETLNEEVSLLRTPSDDDIVLEEDCDWEYLHVKKLVICGGRIEWLSKIKHLFPQWKYIENDNIRFDGQILKDTNIDAIVFNKRFVSHGLFYRVMSQKTKGIPLIYINTSNVEFALQMICNKLKIITDPSCIVNNNS